MQQQGTKAPYVRTGDRFGRWTVLEDGIHSMGPVSCRCECGTEKLVIAQSMRRGLSRSCGCLRAEAATVQATKHGLSTHPLFNTWAGMVDRCTKPHHRDWADYGGRGITVCERWLGPDGLVSFIADMGPKPTPRHSVDRTDNDRGYEPGNCRWATRAEQMRNTRPKARNAAYAAALAEVERLRQLVRDLGGDLDVLQPVAGT